MIHYFPVVTGSLIVSGNLSVTGTATVTASSATTASNALTASSADTFIVRNNLTGSNALFTGAITAQTLVVQTITSSIEYATGSNRFGSLLTDRQTFTGSLFITGSSANFSNQVCGLMGNFSCVGVGTTTPAYKLDVCGTGYIFSLSGGGTSRIATTINNTSGNLEFGLEGSTGNQLFTGMGAYQAGIGTSNNTNFNIATNTNVRATVFNTGITCFACQICAPQLRLTGSANMILQPSFIGSSNLRNGGAIQYTRNFTIFTDDGITGCGFDLQYWNGSAYYPGLRLNNVSSGFASLLLMQDGGNVGLGTTNLSTEANLFLGAQGTIEGGQLVLQKGTSCSCTTHLDNFSDSFRVLVGTDTTSNGVHMLIDHKTKNVCVYGTISGAIGLDVNPVATSPSNAGIGYGVFGLSGIGLGIASGASGANQGIAIFTCGNNERIRIVTSGVTCFGFTVCAPCFATISDYRMKTNLRPIEGLSIIMNTKPYKFDYVYDCAPSFGVVAHELQQILPEAVFGVKDGETMQGVDYMKLLPITIKAIQEQQCLINQLRICLGIN